MNNQRTLKHAICFLICIASLAATSLAFDKPQMYYTDSTYGRLFAKDPDVVKFAGAYYMYYSMRTGKGIAVGIAKSTDLTNWKKVGCLLPGEGPDHKGLAAPAAIILDNKVHLFYQSYGQGRKDAICHAVSEDAINFKRNPQNPIFRPTGDWNCGRAIDADVIVHNDKLLLYWATRDPAFKTQMIGVSSAPLGSDYAPDKWTQLCNKPILKPQLPWEKQCIEASAVVRHNNKLFMFYAGAYNNQPQQIGCATSTDGVQWKRLSDQPLLPNGQPDEWNASESGHPGIFTDDDSQMYLFFQGNNDKGKTWFLSKMPVKWKDNKPHLIRPKDKKQFHLKTKN